jgi:hypothetical protein
LTPLAVTASRNTAGGSTTNGQRLDAVRRETTIHATPPNPRASVPSGSFRSNASTEYHGDGLSLTVPWKKK